MIAREQITHYQGKKISSSTKKDKSYHKNLWYHTLFLRQKLDLWIPSFLDL